MNEAISDAAYQHAGNSTPPFAPHHHQIVRARLSELGDGLPRAAAQTNFDVEESTERFQRDLERLGVDAELRRAGIVAGDLVRFGEVELEWSGDALAMERWA